MDGIAWDLHPGPPALNDFGAVETREEFALIGARRLPIVREACESGKYNAIVLLGGGDPGFLEAREVGHAYGIPVTSCANAQMHVASMLGARFSVLDVAELHNMRMRDVVVQYGFADRCASIRNINFHLPRPSNADVRLIAGEKEKASRGETSAMLEAAICEIEAAIEDDGADVMMMGCSAAYWLQPQETHLGFEFERSHQPALIDDQEVPQFRRPEEARQHTVLGWGALSAGIVSPE